MGRRSAFAVEETGPGTIDHGSSIPAQKDDRVWSEQQYAIFRWFGKGPQPTYGSQLGIPTLNSRWFDQHLIVRARAGTGKTTTIIEGVNRAPESSILLCAFNKKIADELNSRITNRAAQAKTLHAVGYAAIRNQWRVPVAEGSKRADWLTDQVCKLDTPKQIKRLVSLLHTKARDMHPLQPTEKDLLNLALRFDYVPDEGWTQYPLEYCAEKALDAMLRASQEEPTTAIGIDFADMIYLPLVWGLLHPTYELVVVDEAQDMTLSQLTIAQKLCSGRLCLVGDDKQAIYGFRGADSNSLDRLKDELGAAELPLTTTYRCAQTIVKQAQRLVPDIQAGPTNPEGVIDRTDYEHLLAGAQGGDFVLSRLNAPLVSLTLAFLRRKKRARMAGRDIGQGIQTVLKKLGVYTSIPVEDMLVRLDAWERKTCTRFATYGQEDLVARCHDQADMIRALAEDADTTDDIARQCDWLFVEQTPGDTILCSSVHKAKGLEANRVWIMQESLYRRGWTQEEANIEYVATTRAKSHLTFVTGVPTLKPRS